MEKIFALQGSIGGTVRVHTENGRTALRVCTSAKLPKGCTVYLLCSGALKAFPINGAAGSVAEELSPEALLVAAGETILAEGGFAGKKEARRSAEFSLRLLAQSAEKHKTAETAGTEEAENAAEEAAVAEEAAKDAARDESTQATRVEADRSSNDNNYNEETLHKPARPQSASARTPCANAFPDVLSEILRRAHTLFGPLHEVNAAAESNHAETNSTEGAQAQPFRPFSDFYPEAEWRKVPYPGTSRCYLEGRLRAERLVLHGIPGEYAPVPPVPGFKKFLRDRDGCGYWIRIRKI